MATSKRRVLVTGAAGEIGSAVVLQLIKEDFEIIVQCRNEKDLRLEKIKKQVRGKTGRNLIISVFDFLSHETEADSWIESLRSEYGELDGVIHCAGVQSPKTIRDFNRQYFLDLFTVNVSSAFEIAKGLRKRRRGQPCKLVLLSSIAAYLGQPSNTVYAASKSALNSVCKGLANELKRDNISVTAIAPGMVESQIADRTETLLGLKQYKGIKDKHPQGFASSADIAKTITFLLSPEGFYLNGNVIDYEGGYLANI